MGGAPGGFIGGGRVLRVSYHCTILCQAQASYVVGSPVPLPLSPGPPVRLYFLVVLYASPLWAARIESGAGIESGAAIIPARQQRGEQNLINLVRNSRRAATTMDGGPRGSVLTLMAGARQR